MVVVAAAGRAEGARGAPADSRASTHAAVALNGRGGPTWRPDRTTVLNWLLLAAFVPFCFWGVVQSAIHGIRGDLVTLPFWWSSSKGASTYPTVGRLLVSSDVLGGSVMTGDRLLAIEGEDLRGVSSTDFRVRWSAVARRAPSIIFTIGRDGHPSDIRVPLVAGARWPGVAWWVTLPFVIGTLVLGIVVLLRAGHWHLTRRVDVACMLGALFNMPYFSAPAAPRLEILAYGLALPVSLALALRVVEEYSATGPVQLRVWQRVLPWALALLLSGSFMVGAFVAPWLPDVEPATQLWGLAAVGFLVATLVALARTYSRSDAFARRQLKWAVYGWYVGLVPLVALFVMTSLNILPEWTNVSIVIATIAAAAIPAGALIAIAFYQLFDIDRLFSATLTYSVLIIVAVAATLGIMPRAAHAAAAALGTEPESTQLALSLGLALILVPARGFVRARIDRLLFTERAALERGCENLLTEIAGSTDARKLITLLNERVEALVRPAAAVVYVRDGDAFTPIEARGRTVPPAFASNSALIAALNGCKTPLAAERWTAGRTAPLTPFEQAALRTLDVAVLAPIWRGPLLVAFWCFGPKRSGDIYTATDLALLGAVTNKVGDRLLALDATAMIEQARAMQGALRRYVPDAVAARIACGKDVESGERDVSILFIDLFIDIRGYTGFSERRKAEDIFGTVNRYTEMVSRLVRGGGGGVVEFTAMGCWPSSAHPTRSSARNERPCRSPVTSCARWLRCRRLTAITRCGSPSASGSQPGPPSSATSSRPIV